MHPDEIGPLKEALNAHLSGKTDHFQYEHRIRHESGTYRLFLCRGVAVRGTAKRAIRIAGSLTDTTGRSLAREWVLSAGFLDPLTGLSNRSVFVEKLGRRLEELKQRRGDRFAALYIDLDRFKVVNDSLGHLVGDALLIAVSRRLESCLRQGDALARLGGDEFAILLNELNDEQQANAIAFRIQHALSAPFSIGGKEVFTSASIGIAFGRTQYDNPEEIMRDADTAMYHAKARGKARHELFDADMHARVRDRLGLENDLRHAVANRDFEVHYQPIVSLSTGMCVGFESLVRWKRNGEAGATGDVHPHRRGTGADRAARHMGAAAGLPHVCRLAAAIRNLRPRMHHGQRVEPSADGAELPADCRGSGPRVRDWRHAIFASRSPRRR